MVLRRRRCGGRLLRILQFEVNELLALLRWTALTWGRGKWDIKDVGVIRPRSDQRDPRSKPDAGATMSLIDVTLYIMQ